MKVTVKNVGACEKVLSIDVAPEVIKQEFDAFYSSVAKRAKIPGFRPGHAPRHVLAMHFKKDAHDEVLRNLLTKSFREAVKEQDLPLIGYPQIKNVEFDEAKLRFDAHVEIRPEINLPKEKYTKLSLTRIVTPVETSEVEEVVKRYQEAHAKFEAVESRAAGKDDFLIADYRLIIDGKEIEKREGEWFQIRDKDYLEGFSAQLSGAHPGENREVKVRFPENYARKEYAGKEAVFSLLVKEVKEKKVPPADDDLAKEIGEYQTFDELKASVKKDLEAHKRIEADKEMEKSLFDRLIDSVSFQIPNGMVDRRAQAIGDDMAQRMMAQGVAENDVSAQKEKMKGEFHKEAERQIRLSFILDEIAHNEKIVAEPTDFESRFNRIALQLRRPVDEIAGFYREKEERMESLEIQIINEKVVQWVKDHADIQEQIKENK